MKLNPEKLGSVEVTLIQRGSNVIVKLNSNASALNILSQNVAELKAQLALSGLSNVTLNMGTTQAQTTQAQQSNDTKSENETQKDFNNQDSQKEKQEEKREQQKPKQLLDIYKNLNLDENEYVENLEIVLPRYI